MCRQNGSPPTSQRLQPLVADTGPEPHSDLYSGDHCVGVGMTDDTDSLDGGLLWLFFVGLLVFFGSLVLFVVDIARNVDVFRATVANAAGAVLLILWAAIDTYTDPDSEVSTPGGAAGTALLLYGLYLLLAGAVLVATGLVFHTRGVLGFWYLPLAVFTIVVGFLVFPGDAIPDTRTGHDEGADESDDAGADEPGSDAP